MIQSIELENYRSFVKAKANLSPFTLVIGPNGAGKSNFAKLFDDLHHHLEKTDNLLPRHFNCLNEPQTIKVEGATYGFSVLNGKVEGTVKERFRLYKIDPKNIGLSEEISNATVGSDGSNLVSVLDGLKNGHREDLFNQIEAQLKKYIPTIEKLSSTITKPGHKRLQVKESSISEPISVAALSEGTRLLLAILTIVYQEVAPDVIVIEDIDYGLHPRLYSKLVENLRDLVEEKGIQIIATTHNPYMVDQFDGDEEAVLIIEKENGESTITSLAERLEKSSSLEGALGTLWFGGFVGGVPTK